MSRSLSVSGKEGVLATRTIDEDPNFDREHGNLQEIMHTPDLNSPSHAMIKNLSGSLDSPKQPKLYRESAVKLYAQENLEKSLKNQRDDVFAFSKQMQEGSASKDIFDSLMVVKDPESIDIKASLKEKFRSLTQAHQPKPGPGSYATPTQFLAA